MQSDHYVGLVGAPNSICDVKFWNGSEQKAKELAARAQKSRYLACEILL